MHMTLGQALGLTVTEELKIAHLLRETLKTPEPSAFAQFWKQVHAWHKELPDSRLMLKAWSLLCEPNVGRHSEVGCSKRPWLQKTTAYSWIGAWRTKGFPRLTGALV